MRSGIGGWSDAVAKTCWYGTSIIESTRAFDVLAWAWVAIIEGDEVGISIAMISTILLLIPSYNWSLHISDFRLQASPPLDP